MKERPIALSFHDRQVARAILAHLWDLSAQRIRSVDNVIYATVDGPLSFARKKATDQGWRYPSTVGLNPVPMVHDKWPGARLDINYNVKPGGRDVSVSVYRVEAS